MADARSSCGVERFAASDGYVLKYRRYTPHETPKANIVCIHGIQSHGGWYTHSCSQLADRGFQVFFIDRRGSGLNETSRGDAPGFRRLLDDLGEFIVSPGFIASRRIPVFLIGISWGGKLGIGLQRRHPGLVDGLAFLCPGLFAKVRPKLRERLAIAKARLFSPEKRFPIPLSDPALFTSSPKWQQFIRDDPMSLREATARLLVESIRLDGYLRVCRRYVTLPVLLMLAEQDRIIDNDRTRRYFEKLPSTDKTVIEYRGAHHTLEFEPEPDVFVSDLLRWIEERVGRTLANRPSDR